MILWHSDETLNFLFISRWLGTLKDLTLNLKAFSSCHNKAIISKIRVAAGGSDKVSVETQMNVISCHCYKSELQWNSAIKTT